MMDERLSRGILPHTEDAESCVNLKNAPVTTSGSNVVEAGDTLYEVGGGGMSALDSTNTAPPRSLFCQITASLGNAAASPVQRSDIPAHYCGACHRIPEGVQAAVLVQT